MIDNKQSVIILFFIVLFILPLPYFFRFANDNNVFMGSESHYHARMASEIIQTGWVAEDPLYGRKYKPNPYHFLLAGIGLLIPVEFASIVLPVVLGLLSVLFLYLFFSSINFKYLRSFFVLFVFIFSPMFISVFSLSTPRALAVFLLILGMFLFVKKSKIWLFSLLIFAVLALIGILDLFIVLIILFMYCLHNKKNFGRFYVCFFVLFLILIGFHLPFYFIQGISFYSSDKILSDLGGIYGFSVFSLLLSIIGLFFVWRYKKRLYRLYLSMIMLLIVCFMFRLWLVYANIFISILAGSAFYVLYVKKWHLRRLRGFALLVIFCGFLFAALSHAVVLSELPPNDDLVNCLEQASGFFPESGLFLTSAKDGFFAEFWAEKPVFVNEFSTVNVGIAETIWNSVDIRETRKLFKENNISYILIHKDMFAGNIWDKKDQGLHFLLGNSETFKRRYHNEYCEIWKFSYNGGLNG
ncbi:hypothetical protein GF358_01735 [Candidatus Woesearchaeota archaeon]|nr:hypothetical protein [Candidatus Woesearchaeota archaeon]